MRRQGLPSAQPDDPDGKAAVSTIARSGGANLVGAAISALASFAIVILVSRMWSLQIAGSLFAVTSIFLIVLALSQLGIDQGLVRFIAWNTARGDGGNNRHLIIRGFTVALGASIVMLLVGLALAGPLSRLLSENGDPEATRAMIVVFAVALPVAAAYELLLAVTRGLAKMRPTILVDRILRPLLQLGAVAYAGVAGADASGLALAWTAPYWAGLVCAVASLWIIRRANPGILTPAPSINGKTISSEFWRFTIPRGFTRLAQVGLQRADIAIVVIVAGPDAGAIYTAVTRFLVMGQLAASAIQQVSEPQVARLLAVQDIGGAAMVARRLTVWTVLLTWPIYLVIAVYAEFLLELLFGGAYGDGALSLQVLALAMLFATAMGPLDVLLLMAGRSSLSLINTMTALAIDVAGCLLLIPHLGITGAAVAWAAAIVAKNLLCFFQVKRSLGITPASKEMLMLSLVLGVLFGALPWLSHHLIAVQPSAEVGVLCAVTTGYLVLVWLRRRQLLTGHQRAVPLG